MGFSINLAPLGKAFESWGQAKHGKRIEEYKQLQTQAAQAIQLISTSPPDSPEHQRGLKMLQQVEAQVIDDPEARAELQKMSTDARIQSNIKNIQQRRPDVTRSFPQNNPNNPQVFADTDFSLQGYTPGIGAFDEKGKQLGVGGGTFKATGLSDLNNQLQQRINNDNWWKQTLINDAVTNLKNPTTVQFLQDTGQAEAYTDLVRRLQSDDDSAIISLQRMNENILKQGSSLSSTHGSKLSVVGQEVREQQMRDYEKRVDYSQSVSFDYWKQKRAITQADKAGGGGDPSDILNKGQSILKQGYNTANQLQAQIDSVRTKLGKGGTPFVEALAQQESMFGNDNGFQDLALLENYTMQKYGRLITQVNDEQLNETLGHFKDTYPDVLPNFIDRGTRNMLNKINDLNVNAYEASRDDLVNYSRLQVETKKVNYANNELAGRLAVEAINKYGDTPPLDVGVRYNANMVMPDGLTLKEHIAPDIDKINQLKLKQESQGLTNDEAVSLSQLYNKIGDVLPGHVEMSNQQNPIAIKPTGAVEPFNEGGFNTQSAAGVAQELGKIPRGESPLHNLIKEKGKDLPPPNNPKELEIKESIGAYMEGMSPAAIEQIATTGQIPQKVVNNLKEALNKYGLLSTIKGSGNAEKVVRDMIRSQAQESLGE